MCGHNSGGFGTFFVTLYAISFVKVILALYFGFSCSLQVRCCLRYTNSLTFSTSDNTTMFLVFLVGFGGDGLCTTLAIIVNVVLDTSLVFLVVFRRDTLVRNIPIVFTLVDVPVMVLDREGTGRNACTTW